MYVYIYIYIHIHTHVYTHHIQVDDPEFPHVPAHSDIIMTIKCIYIHIIYIYIYTYMFIHIISQEMTLNFHMFQLTVLVLAVFLARRLSSPVPPYYYIEQ